MHGFAGKICSALTLIFLASCSTPEHRPGLTFDRITDEMRAATAKNAEQAASAAEKKPLDSAMLPPLDLPSESNTATEYRFDLAVSSAPAAQVFMAIASDTQFSMLVPPEVSGEISLNLKNVTVREALETIRDLYGYDFKVKGTRIFIQPNSLQTRLFQINYLASSRQGSTQTRVTSSSPSVVNPGSSTGSSGTGQVAAPVPAGNSGANGASDSARVSTTSEVNFWQDLEEDLQTIIGSQDGRSVKLNKHSGVVLVRALPAELRSVAEYLKATQLVVERQVMLEAKIVEVALSETYQSGINWARFGSNTRGRYAIGNVAPGTTLGTSGEIIGNAGGSASGSFRDLLAGTSGIIETGLDGSIIASSTGKGLFGLALQTTHFAGLLSFLETHGEMQVLSSPRVATVNNQKAVLKVGTDDYYVTNISTTTSTSGTGNVTTPSITLQPFFSGVALDVTPQIDDEGNVLLHIHPSVTVVQEKVKVVDLGENMGQFRLPLASSSINETDAIVRVKDGYIVAIGGLMSQEQGSDNNGVPGLSQAKVVGNLFGQRGSGLSKRELVVLIKPTVIQNEESWKQDLLDTAGRIEQLDPRRRPPLSQ